MDVARKPVNRKKKRLIQGGIALAAVAIITMALARLGPAVPTVDRATVMIDTVRRGEMVRQVRGPGRLVPEHIRWVSALTAGRVDQIYEQPGTTVKDSTVLLTLSNPDVQLEELSADQQLSAAKAALVTLETTLETQRLTQESAVATAQADARDAERNARVATALDSKGLLSANEVGSARDKGVAAAERLKAERARLAVMNNSMQRQIALQRAQVDGLRAIARFNHQRVASMQVRAGETGILQELPLQLGQWVTPGTILAKVARPGKLKAVLQIPETQAKDVAVGQRSSIDTRNGLIVGRVMRVYPAAQSGTVTVDVELTGPLPSGARPDLSVDGTIEIARLEHVLYVGRPAYGEPRSTVGLFRLEPGGDYADRVRVKLGQSSVNTIQITNGLRAGDRVIISDMSAWDAQPRVHIK